MKALEARWIKLKAREERVQGEIVRALETAAASDAGECDHDEPKAREASASGPRECMIALATELGSLAADLYSEGLIHVEESTTDEDNCGR